MWAARPHLGSIFEKLLHRKTFWFACGSLLAISMEKLSCSCHVSCETLLELLLEIPLESGSARLGHIPSLPWESQLPLKPCSIISAFCFEGNCDSSSSLLDFYYSSQTVSFASQMWAARPHLGSIFEKLLHRKTFSLPAA